MNSKRKRINKTKKNRNKTKKIGGDPMTLEEAKDNLILGIENITSRKFRDCIKVIKENNMLDNAMMNNGNTLLMLYIEKPNLVKILINEGANVNIEKNDRITALHMAVENNNIEVVKLLINNGGDVNIRTDSGSIPLAFYIYDDSSSSKDILKIIKLLVDADSREINNINGFNGGILGDLLVNTDDILKRNEERDWKNLHNRFEKLYEIYQMIKYLIEEKGADVNGEVEDNECVLWACQQIWIKILEDYNYDSYWYNIINETQSDQKMKDQRKRFLEMKNLPKYLIEKGANVNYQSLVDGSTIGHYLCYDLDPELLDYLGSKGFDYNINDNTGNNLFHSFAVNTYSGKNMRKGKWVKLAQETFNILKKNGVNLDGLNDLQGTPLYETLDFFLNEVDNNNNLHHIPLNNREISVLLHNIKLFLLNGANPYIWNDEFENTSEDLLKILINNEEIDIFDRSDLQDSFETFKHLWVNSEAEKAIFINDEELMKNEILLKLKTKDNKHSILNAICNTYLLNREAGINFLNKERETLDGKSILEYVVLNNITNDKGQTLLMYTGNRNVLNLLNKIKEIKKIYENENNENNKRKKI